MSALASLGPGVGSGFRSTSPVADQSRLLTEGQGFDAIFFVSELAAQDFQGMVKVPVPLYQNETVAVTVRPGVKITSRPDLKNDEVGIERGNRVQMDVVKGVRGVTETVTPTNLMKMLVGGRLDVALFTRGIVPSLAREAGAPPLYVQEPPLAVVPLFFVLTATGAWAEPRLTPVFPKMVASGRWAQEVSAIFRQMDY